jgi:hypothetical protein
MREPSNRDRMEALSLLVHPQILEGIEDSASFIVRVDKRWDNMHDNFKGCWNWTVRVYDRYMGAGLIGSRVDNLSEDQTVCDLLNMLGIHPDRCKLVYEYLPEEVK